MSESPAPDPAPGGGRPRPWPLFAALALLVLTPLSLWPGAAYGGASRLLRVANGAPVQPHEQAMGLLTIARIYYDWQYTSLLLILGLTLYSTYRLFPILWGMVRTGLAGPVVAAEVGLVFWLVYGGMSGMGMPGLFWNPSPWNQFLAGLGVTLFVFWMLYLLFVRDLDAHRGDDAPRAWDRLVPALEAGGLPAFLRIDPARASGAGRFAWFLGYAGLPALVILIGPAVLPAVRPGYHARIVAVPWLSGVLLGATAIAVISGGRIPSRIHELWRQLTNRRLEPRHLLVLDPGRVDPHAHSKNILAILALIFLASYVVPGRVSQFFPPAFSACALLGVIATAVTWLGTRRWRTRAIIGAVGLVLVASAGVLDYEVELRDLDGRYPPAASQLARRLDPDGIPPASYTPIVADLAAYQKAHPFGAGGPAVRDRQRTLDRWAKSLRDTGHARAPAGKPLLVVLTTSGGALRAALWTETVLRTLDQKLDGFHRHLRLITGASGGMLGAAHYVGSHADGRGPNPAELQSDYLSPIAWRLAFRDIVPNAVVPFATYNRADALEDEWVHHAPSLGHTFAELKPKEDAGLIPSLVFSPMLVEDGRRLIISNQPLADLTSNHGLALIEADKALLAEQFLKSQPPAGADPSAPAPKPPDEYDLEFPGLASVSAVEFFALLGEGTRPKLRLASAVRMSATFPYITSVATIPTYPPRHVVDAGYYDNYGVNLAGAWIASHRAWIRDNAAGVLVVQVRAFRNEKRIKNLDEEIHSVPKTEPVRRGLLRSVKDHAVALIRMIPSSVALVSEGVRALVIPVQGVAKARESSMFFRNDEQLLALHAVFTDLTGDPDFFRTVIFTCDTLQVGRSTQNVETLNWYMEPGERRQVERNMQPLDPVHQTGRDRNDQRLKELMAWWYARGGVLRAPKGS